MHHWRLGTALGLCAMLAGALGGAAIVYKWTDADGVVHFSDQSVPGAERIVTSSGALHGDSRPVSSSVAAPAPAQVPAKSASTLDFKQFAIVSPANEENIPGSGSVTVRLALDPGLNAMQSITWYLNGSPLTDQAPDATQFTLNDLPRGTYTLGATVVDQSSSESKSTDTVTFYVTRPSVLSPQHK